MNKTYCIYCHTFPNGKMYFGQTCADPKKRWGKNGYGYRKQKLIHNAIQKYGWDNIDHRIISIGLDKDEADFQEMFYISAYRTNEIEFGYNIRKGGDGMSEEHKKNLSIANKGKHKRCMSDETKKKISEGHKGIHFTEEHKRNLSIANKGKHSNIIVSEETRRKISEAGKGRIFSAESRKKNSDTQKGRPQPKYKWLTPEGEIKEMGVAQVSHYHKDWIKISDLNI